MNHHRTLDMKPFVTRSYRVQRNSWIWLLDILLITSQKTVSKSPNSGLNHGTTAVSWTSTNDRGILVAVRGQGLLSEVSSIHHHRQCLKTIGGCHVIHRLQWFLRFNRSFTQPKGKVWLNKKRCRLQKRWQVILSRRIEIILGTGNGWRNRSYFSWTSSVQSVMSPISRREGSSVGVPVWREVRLTKEVHCSPKEVLVSDV